MTPPMEFKSKTEKKKDALHLQKLGEKLLHLSPAQLKGIPIPEELLDAIKNAKRINKHGGLRRQMQYIGTLMRKVDHLPIKDAIHDIENAQHNEAALFKKLEGWRDDLIGGNDPLVEEILQKYPNTDRQQFTQLIRSAKKEISADNPSKAYRSLFKFLKNLES